MGQIRTTVPVAFPRRFRGGGLLVLLPSIALRADLKAKAYWQPGGARRSQEEPEGAKRSRKESGGARRSQGEPGGARSRLGEPGGALMEKVAISCWT
jgi:hypothetical protein